VIGGKLMNSNGKPPKTTSQIRSKLESIRSSTGAAQQIGPLNDQTNGSQQIVLASFFNHELGKQLQKELTQKKLFPETYVRWRKLFITVDRSDLATAILISGTFRKRHPDRRNSRESARYDYLIFGMLIGFAFAVVFVTGSRNLANGISFVLATVGIFGAAGHLIGRARNRNTHFDLWNMLILVAIIGMLISLIRILPAILR